MQIEEIKEIIPDEGRMKCPVCGRKVNTMVVCDLGEKWVGCVTCYDEVVSQVNYLEWKEESWVPNTWCRGQSFYRLVKSWIIPRLRRFKIRFWSWIHKHSFNRKKNRKRLLKLLEGEHWDDII